jgi:hypothetical protein
MEKSVDRNQAVALKLHRWYTKEEAVAAFGDPELAEPFCDGQFMLLPKAVLCLIEVREGESGSHLSGPDHVVWRPARLDYHPSESYPWLPERVHEVWDRSGEKVRKLRDHQMFLRLPADDRYFYAGVAHLGSYGGRPPDLSATFSLYKKLPQDTWLRFGGYRGWLIADDRGVHRVDEGDTRTFDRLLGELRRQQLSHLSLTRYAGDSLTIHTNARRGWLMYLREPADSGLYVRDPEYTGDPEAEELFQCECGIDLELAAALTLSRDRAIHVVEEFFRTGELPRGVEWSKEGDVPCDPGLDRVQGLGG